RARGGQPPLPGADRRRRPVGHRRGRATGPGRALAGDRGRPADAAGPGTPAVRPRPLEQPAGAPTDAVTATHGPPPVAATAAVPGDVGRRRAGPGGGLRPAPDSA